MSNHSNDERCASPKCKRRLTGVKPGSSPETAGASANTTVIVCRGSCDGSQISDKETTMTSGR